MFRFAVEIDLSRPLTVGPDGASARCMFRHFNPGPVEFSGTRSPNPLNLGFRLFKHRTNELVFEDRLIPASQLVEPEIWVPFEMKIPRRAITTHDSYDLLVDLVIENQYWFHERGRSGTRLEVTFTERSDAEAAEAPGPAQSGFGEAFVEAFRDRSFADYSHIKRFYSGEPAEQRSRLPSDLLEVMNKPVGSQHDDKLQLTRLMQYYSLINRHDFNKAIGSRSGRLGLLQKFFEVSQRITGAPSDYFPPDLVGYLNELVLFDGLFEIPLSRLMLWYWLSEGRQIQPSLVQDQEKIYWWWVTGAMPANQIPDTFIPKEIVSYLGGCHEQFRGRVVELSRFAHLAYRESSELKVKYDLSKTTDLVAYSFDFVFHNLRHPINRNFIGSGVRSYWKTPFQIGGQTFTRFEIALLAQHPTYRPDVLDGLTVKQASEARALLDRAISTVNVEWAPLCIARPSHDDRKPAVVRQIRNAGAPIITGPIRKATVTVAGMAQSPSGLGVNMRMSCKTFETMQMNVCSYDTTRKRFVGASQPAANGPVLFHVNADMIGEVLTRDDTGMLSKSYRMGFFLWELDTLPLTHVFGADLVDEIWAPTQFVADVYANHTDKTVKLVKKFILMPDLPPKVSNDDEDGIYSFLTSFDYHSGVERKNPYAVIRAFQNAFPPHMRDVRLTVKTTEYVPGHWGDANNQWFLINEAAARDPRISVIVDAMPEQEFFALIRDHDCIVSSHRAEGFGYLPAYAMFFEKAVITTDYSGTTDFCTPETSYPVSYKLAGVRPGEFIIDVPGARWADVDIDHLTDCMRQVYHDRSAARRKGRAGSNLIRTEYSLESHGYRYAEALRSA